MEPWLLGVSKLQSKWSTDAGEARTRGPSVSSQTLYHWATGLPPWASEKSMNNVVTSSPFIFSSPEPLAQGEWSLDVRRASSTIASKDFS